MKREYWEKMASTYNEEIFDVLKNDKKALISNAISQYANKEHVVADIGCAIGKWIPVLSPLFDKVYAIDISKKNLSIARKLYSSYTNVTYLRANMSDGKKVLPACEVGLCINAILTPSKKARNQFFSSVATCIKKNGVLILTVPSLESHLLMNIIQQQFRIDKKLFPRIKNPADAIRKWNNIRKGNADIDEVPHKHYLKEELQLLLGRENFSHISFRKIEYDWTTEFVKPPHWLKEPKPWDWMVTATKQ